MFIKAKGSAEELMKIKCILSSIRGNEEWNWAHLEN